mgnify:CR=1 FL=1
MKRIVSIFLLTYPILVFTGCGHISTYQSPKILNQGEKLWGTGISINTNKEFINEFPIALLSDLSIYTRYGLSERSENGFKISFSLPFLLTSYHYKYLLLQTAPVKSMKKPLLVSGDLGLSIGLVNWLAFGFHPTLLFGREDFYGGVSTNFILPFEYLPSRIFLGASMGDNKWRLNTEISYDTFSYSVPTAQIFHGQITAPNQTIVVGFSFQRIFGKKDIVARKVARNERLRKIKKELGITSVKEEVAETSVNEEDIIEIDGVKYAPVVSEDNVGNTEKKIRINPSIVDKTFSVHSGLGSARGIGLIGFSKDLLITDNMGVYFSGGMGTPVSSTHMTYGVGTYFQSHYNDNGWNIATVLGMASTGGAFINTGINYQMRIGNSGIFSFGFIRGEFFNKDPQYHMTEYPYGMPIISYNFRF